MLTSSLKKRTKRIYPILFGHVLQSAKQLEIPNLYIKKPSLTYRKIKEENVLGYYFDNNHEIILNTTIPEIFDTTYTKLDISITTYVYAVLMHECIHSLLKIEDETEDDGKDDESSFHKGYFAKIAKDVGFKPPYQNINLSKELNTFLTTFDFVFSLLKKS